LNLTEIDLSAQRRAALSQLVREDRERSARGLHIDPLTRADNEAELESWLEDRGAEAAWELAPPLVSLGYGASDLAQLEREWGNDLTVVLGWLARAQPVLALTREIEEATRRISEIVRSLKTYSFLGQAPVRAVDVREGIESTLVMLRSKLKDGITVQREYAPDVPPIEAFGAELNQVWTNIIDNAVDATGGNGRIIVRARRDGNDVVIEFEDNGPGMSEHVRQCIFDPFFTTKEPGKGTGLGLSTSRNIVVKKHGGSIDVVTRPGSTNFLVRLPIRHSPPDVSEPQEAPGNEDNQRLISE
jgi:signal transduction histidine kinase